MDVTEKLRRLKNVAMVDEFLESLVSKLGIMFASPEEDIITQDEESFDMFFVTFGDCIVNIRDRFKEEQYCVRLITEGGHFGEISAIYQCPRTATVISRTYTTFAVLGDSHFREVMREFPEYQRQL